LQISIYKDKIFSSSYLEKSFLNMLINLNDIFAINNFKEKNLYFGYVFDFSRIYDYDKILSDCKKEGWNYCFFDTDKKIFCTKGNKEINDINQIVTKVIVDRNKLNDELPLTFQNLFETTIINRTYLYIIKDLVSKEKCININHLKYIGEKEGPIIKDNIINVLVSAQFIEVIFVKNNILKAKSINKTNKKISDFIIGGVELDKYHIYEFN
jgi:hypothetical protein